MRTYKTRLIRKSLAWDYHCLIFYDIFLSRSVTLTERQTTSSCLWYVTGTSPQHVKWPCAFYCTNVSRRQSRIRTETCSFLSFLLSLWMLTAVACHAGTRQLCSPEQIQRGFTSKNKICKFHQWERNVCSWGLAFCRLIVSSLSFKINTFISS